MKYYINIVIVLLILAGCKTLEQEPEPVNSIVSDRERIADLRMHVDQLYNQIDELYNQIDELEDENARLRNENHILESNLMMAPSSEIHYSESEISEMENEIEILNAEIKALEPVEVTCYSIDSIDDFIVNLYNIQGNRILLDGSCENLFKKLVDKNNFKSKFPTDLYYFFTVDSDLINVNRIEKINARFKYTTDKEEFLKYVDEDSQYILKKGSVKISSPSDRIYATLNTKLKGINISALDEYNLIEFNKNSRSINWNLSPDTNITRSDSIDLELILRGVPYQGEGLIDFGEIKTEGKIIKLNYKKEWFALKPINVNVAITSVLALFSGLFLEKFRHRLRNQD